MAQDDLVTLIMAEDDLTSQPIERVVHLMEILPNEALEDPIPKAVATKVYVPLKIT